MRIAELSRRSGVAVPTIKYYLREGMLPPGERTSPNQALYDETHVHRLRLVRALIDVGGLSVAAVRDVLATVDSSSEDMPTRDLDRLMGTVQKAVLSIPDPADEAVQAEAEREVVDLIAERDWICGADHPAVGALATVLVTAQALGHSRFLDAVRRYAEAMELVAVVDLDYVAQANTVDDMLESVVIGTVLGDSAMMALRRLAESNESGKRYGRRKPDSA
ncbi:MerR family transcriptional regulator [Actinokineospora iranica]|uniref:MerR family transcriptional regulator n=1 Tax=Actinokineospora iranica TaxID=1271860 RepID=UPI000B85A296|nr:MerR family transcriptional regulator [Actinokineospora iranica]